MAKSSTERSKDRRARLTRQGYKELRNFWTKPEHERVVRAYAKFLDSKTKE